MPQTEVMTGTVTAAAARCGGCGDVSRVAVTVGDLHDAITGDLKCGRVAAVPSTHRGKPCLLALSHRRRPIVREVQET